MKNLYIVYGCNKYWDRLSSSKDTWLKHMSKNEDYIILGEVDIPELKMAGFTSDDGSYLNLGMRTLLFLDKYSDFLRKWDWITFVDDDAYIFKRRLRKKLEKEDTKGMGIIMGKTPGNRVFQMNGYNIKFALMHGGATISLNNIAINRMLDYLDNNRSWLYDRSKVDPSFLSFGDVCVSFLCRKTRAKIINCPYLMSFSNYKDSRLKMADYYKIITSHYLSNEDKKNLYKVDFSERN